LRNAIESGMSVILPLGKNKSGIAQFPLRGEEMP